MSNFVDGQLATAASVNAAFATKTTKFTGSGAPGSVSGSVLGDTYMDTANGDEYVCNAAGPCTAVAAGNWVKVSGASAPFSDWQKKTASITLDATDKTIYTTTLTAGALAAGKVLEVIFQIQHTTGGGTPTYKLWFGGTSYTLLSGSSDASLLRFRFLWANNPGATNAQQIVMWPFDFSTNSQVNCTGGDGVTTAINTTASVIVKVTANESNSNAVTGFAWFLRVTP